MLMLMSVSIQRRVCSCLTIRFTVQVVLSFVMILTVPHLMETWANQQDRSAAQRPRRQDNRSQQSQLPRPRQPALSLESTQIHPQRPQQLAYATASTTAEAERVLLHATARLALETSHKVRTLQAIVARTLTVPDTC